MDGWELHQKAIISGQYIRLEFRYIISIYIKIPPFIFHLLFLKQLNNKVSSLKMYTVCAAVLKKAKVLAKQKEIFSDEIPK